MPFAQEVAASAPLVFGLLGCWLLGRAAPVGHSGVAVAVALFVTSAVWSQVQKVYEGPTVISVTASRGLTIADLVIVPSLGIVAALLVRARRESHESA